MDVIAIPLKDKCHRYGDGGSRIVLDWLIENVKPMLTPGSFIAGGAVRDLLMGVYPRKDIDVFCTDAGAYLKFVSGMNGRNKPTGLPNMVSKFAMTWEKVLSDPTHPDITCRYIPIQAVSLVIGSPQYVIGEFDFTVSQFATDLTTLWTTYQALTNLSERQIVVNKITYSVASVRRFARLANLGFTCNFEQAGEFFVDLKDAPYQNLLDDAGEY